MSITIRHTRATGTLVYGTTRGDGAALVLKEGRFRPSRNLPEGAYWYLPRSRDQSADRWAINAAADALRTRGFTVEVEIDDATPGRSFTEAEQERNERAQERAARFDTHAHNAAERAQTHESAYRSMSEHWPMGQPLISDAARRAHGRMVAADERSRREQGKAAHWSSRAETAGRYQASRENVRTTLRRIERLEARRRRLERELEGPVELLAVTTTPPEGAIKLDETPLGIAYRLSPTGERRERLEADLAQVSDEVAYWREYIAHAEEQGVKIWGPKDFTKGDFVKHHGTWVEVLRVNSKSVTVPWAHLWIGRTVYTRADAEANTRGRRPDGRLYTDTLPYDKVTGRASAEDIRRKFTDRADGA